MLLRLRVGCALAACGVLLAACSGAGPSDKPLVVSPETNAHLQTYLDTGDESRSAFAVSADGKYSFYLYCESGGCHGQYNLSQEAIKRCEALGHGRCVILGSNGMVKRPYTVGN